ncbi:MAG: hypothetical protein QS721_09215 [Candidatus Endonucleobacter sp. (ex Gigantidas childressi)]|nr:hypothetical protein [Candidatus Endonucleobacter sp. (ex Gigantidas childressi)]
MTKAFVYQFPPEGVGLLTVISYPHHLLLVGSCRFARLSSTHTINGNREREKFLI